MVGRAEIERAIGLYRAGRRPKVKGSHYDWHIVEETTGEIYPVKLIWALAFDIQDTTEFHTQDAQRALLEAGFNLVNTANTSIQGVNPVQETNFFELLQPDWEQVLSDLQSRFTTQDFRNLVEKGSAHSWKEIQKKYGRGGRGGGNFYSPANILFNFLRRKEREGIVSYIGLVPSRRDWGSHLVAEWALASVMNAPPPSEQDRELWEGTERLRNHLVRERARGIRDEVLKARLATGLRCEMCGLQGRGLDEEVKDSLFEAHHSKEPFAGKGVKPVKIADMALLCACCHRLIHRLIRISNRWIMPDEASKIAGKMR